MATFTLVADCNIDSLVGRVGDDTININGCVLTWDEHSRYGVNSNTSATVAALTASATLGGSLKIEGRYVRLLYFTGGSGNVPAYNTTISQGSASGLHIGTYSALNVAPTTPGSAMPASGYILIKQWNSVAFGSGALTGIGATCAADPVFSTYDRAGWIEHVARGNTATNYTLSRLNNPTDPVCYGVPFYIGVTDGTRATTYQIPTNGVYQYHAGVFVESGTGTGIWEFYPATNDAMTIANLPTDAVKGKWCKIDYTTGLVRFGHDGTNSTGGYCPPAGRNVVIGNIFMTGADTAAKTQNYYSATTSARGRWITSGAGRVDCRWTSFNWGFGSLTTPQYFNLNHCGVIDNITLTNPAIAPTLTNGGIGCPQGFTSTNLTISSNAVGTTMTDYVIGKSGHGATANVHNLSTTDCVDTVMDGCKLLFSGARGINSQTAWTGSRADGVTMTDCVFSSTLVGSSTSNVTITGGQYYNSNTPNDTTNAVYMVGVSTQSLNWVIDGVTIDDGDLPRNGFLSGGSSSANIVFKNIGTRANPIDTGVPRGTDEAWTRVTTTLTVNKVAHGLNTNDIIVATITPSGTIFNRGVFTVTRIDADNFSFTCSNAGATSGLISYYLGHMARYFLLANNDTVKFQNVHALSCRTATYGMDNSCTNVYIENCTSDVDHYLANVTSANNLYMYGSTANSLNQTAVSSTYGTLIRSGFVADTTVPDGTGVSWTRSSTTITVTKTGHGLMTGSRIQVLDSSSPTSITQGAVVTATVLDANTFTFAGINAGSASGTLDYKTSDGTLFIDMNEDNTASDAQYSVVAGTPLFTGTGGLLMGTVNDQVEWVTERYITDYDHAANMLPFMAGGTIANHELYYDIDTGSGYSGSFKNAYIQRSGAAGTSGTAVVTVTDTTGVNAGDFVYGIGIATGAKVQSVDSSTQLTLTINNTSTVSGTLYFSYLPNITGLTSTGFKMKIRCKTITTNTAAITYIRMFFSSTSTTRDVLYPQEVLPYQSVTISGATAGSRIQLYDLTAAEELYNGTPTFPYTWTDTDEYEADREIRLRVSYVSGTTAKEYISTTIGTATQASPDLTYLVTQTDDTVYNTNAVNGSTTTGITISATRYSLTVSRTCAQIYAFAMYTAFTETGIRDYGLAMSAVDTANYFLDEVLLKNTSSAPAIAISITGGWLRDFDTGVALDLVDTTGGTLFLAPDHVVAYGSTLTEADLTDIRLTNLLVKDSLS